MTSTQEDKGSVKAYNDAERSKAQADKRLAEISAEMKRLEDRYGDDQVRRGRCG